MPIRAKFRCANTDLQPGNPPMEAVTLNAVADDSPENKAWSEATPSGTLDIFITNPAAQGKFVRGNEYWIDISPVDPPPATSSE